MSKSERGERNTDHYSNYEFYEHGTFQIPSLFVHKLWSLTQVGAHKELTYPGISYEAFC